MLRFALTTTLAAAVLALAAGPATAGAPEGAGPSDVTSGAPDLARAVLAAHTTRLAERAERLGGPAVTPGARRTMAALDFDGQQRAAARLTRTVHRLKARRAARQRIVRAVAAKLAVIRACESGGDYTTNTGNGFYGAYQFDRGTWASVGGSGVASDAPPAEQDLRAAMLMARSGSSPWPVCGA